MIVAAHFAPLSGSGAGGLAFQYASHLIRNMDNSSSLMPMDSLGAVWILVYDIQASPLPFAHVACNRALWGRIRVSLRIELHAIPCYKGLTRYNDAHPL